MFRNFGSFEEIAKAEIKRRKDGGRVMKKYRIVKNYDEWGFDVDVPNDENTIIDEDELKRLANDWEKPVEELMEDLEEIMTI